MLTKPEFDNAIVVDELLQIMENLGFRDERNDDSSEEDLSDDADGAEGQNMP